MVWSVQWCLGTMLIYFGMIAGLFAFIAGGGAVVADVLDVGRSAVVYLAITAISWGAVSVYHVWFGSWFREM